MNHLIQIIISSNDMNDFYWKEKNAVCRVNNLKPNKKSEHGKNWQIKLTSKKLGQNKKLRRFNKNQIKNYDTEKDDILYVGYIPQDSLLYPSSSGVWARKVIKQPFG